MKKKIAISIIISLFFLFIAAAQNSQSAAQVKVSVTAQSAADAMAKSKNAEKSGRQSFDNGFYDEAVKLADEATAYAILAKNWFRADGLIKQAENRVTLAIRYKIDTRNPELYKKASDTYAAASSEYKDKQFEKSISDSLQVIELLKDITPPPAVAAPPAPPAEKTYTVKKKIPADCFWRIAGYPEIYNDPTKWPLIYEANKKKLQNPENPDLIQPGMVFVIPPLKK